MDNFQNRNNFGTFEIPKDFWLYIKWRKLLFKFGQ